MQVSTASPRPQIAAMNGVMERAFPVGRDTELGLWWAKKAADWPVGCHIIHDKAVHVQPTSLQFPLEPRVAMFAACECFLGGSVAAYTPNCGLQASYQEGMMAHGWMCFCLLSLHASGWGPPKFGRAPQIEPFKLVCVLTGNKKISRDVKGLFFLGVISSCWIKSNPRSAIVPLQLVGELLRKRGVVSWVVSWAYCAKVL